MDRLAAEADHGSSDEGEEDEDEEEEGDQPQFFADLYLPNDWDSDND